MCLRGRPSAGKLQEHAEQIPYAFVDVLIGHDGLESGGDVLGERDADLQLLLGHLTQTVLEYEAQVPAVCLEKVNI